VFFSFLKAELYFHIFQYDPLCFVLNALSFETATKVNPPAAKATTINENTKRSPFSLSLHLLCVSLSLRSRYAFVWQ